MSVKELEKRSSGERNDFLAESLFGVTTNGDSEAKRSHAQGCTR